MPPHTDFITVERSLFDERLDAFLRGHYSGVSRGTLQRLIRQGAIRVNGQPAKASHHPRLGEKIEVNWPPPEPSIVQPEPMPLVVLFEDADLLVLNKPAGLVVHPAAGHGEHTLVNALLHHCHGQLSGIGGVARPGIVHRLDKDTSGCLVVAKNDLTHLGLARQFADRQVKKIYHALACGDLVQLSGEIRAPIMRHPNHRKVMTVTDGQGRSAWTTYRVLEKFGPATLVEARLHTGRTHQIRAHFKYLGFPLVGDLVYGKRPNQAIAEENGYAAARQMLHASQLAFSHPRAGTKMTFTAPWPEDFAAAVARFRLGAGNRTPGPV
ncbi:MAG: RluA family pseudouridine synthase [Limisphaerales bacterium]